eukprot:CAMPEP_0194065616 /NCGR_PEP_ID=MMETSP0009_2-20130614/85571_1 /TAXON_ID=210454 /ORGANISM="Grammatophora oceanica, Strain CCMP 410" /LENGTH=32 /DNA_ID= /DNA_START= /DNA_END= /DNA_ORIENTATION=
MSSRSDTVVPSFVGSPMFSKWWLQLSGTDDGD